MPKKKVKQEEPELPLEAKEKEIEAKDEGIDESSATAHRLASKQREISISEFFAKNRHLLGFDNPKKALLTTIKEAVDNSLDACEETNILPDLSVSIIPFSEDRFKVIVEDNGPGIVKAQIPKIFGKLLYGSKFHTLKMSRGQQGIGISAAGMYGQITTGKPMQITSRISPKKQAHYYRIKIDTTKNMPVIVEEADIDWDKPRGTRVEIELEAKYFKGARSVDDYLRQTAIANPHVTITYKTPENQEIVYKRSTNQMPEQPKEIKPHPYGVELGTLDKMIKTSEVRKLKSFLCSEFSRVSSKVATEICQKAEVSETMPLGKITDADIEKVFKALSTVKIMAPPTNCIAPIGEELILAGLKSVIEADFYTSKTRTPCVYRGNPFLVEVGLAYGGKQPADQLMTLFRYANRVPLMYQQSACAVTRSIVNTAWHNYGLQQSKSSLPMGPVALFVHIASVWVPFTSESKEAIAHYPEIIKEIKLAVQDCGRQLGSYLSHKRRLLDSQKKLDYLESYVPHIGIALREILSLTEKEENKIVVTLKDTLKKSRMPGVE